MALVTWDQSYSVKVKRCGDDHQKLSDLMNALYEAMRAGRGRSVVGQIVGELSDYTQTHFKAEEALMERANYPGLAGHRVEHHRFVGRVAEFQRELDADADRKLGGSSGILEGLAGQAYQENRPELFRSSECKWNPVKDILKCRT